MDNKYTMNNGLLISLAFIVIFSLSACSEQVLPESDTRAVKPSEFVSGSGKAGGTGSRATTSDAFAQTLHPLLVERCATCHDSVTGVAPLIADANSLIALEELTLTNKVDLIQPGNSRVVTKVAIEAHQCWTAVCADDANVLLASIQQWSALINAGQLPYEQQCASCHGADGQGVAGNIGVTRPLPLTELTALIETTMPTDDPTTCVGTCAQDVAQYIFNNFNATNSTLLSEPLAGFPGGAQQIGILCARLQAQNAQNVVRDAFCGATPPTITGITDLQSALGLGFVSPNATGRRNNGRQGNPAFVLTGHSSSLVARLTSAINPRALIFTPSRGGNANPGFVVMGYVRGDQFAEIVTSDRVTGELQFFLVTFKQACNLTHSCTPGDLLTPLVESNWIEYTVFGQTDLKNTILDCLQCHQTGGPGTQSILRMQELANPWAHFFRNNRQGGTVLIADFQAAHGLNENYAGIPAQLIDASDPALLENLVRNNGFGNQPNVFNSRRILNQVNNTPGQPANNDTPGVSARWQAIYNNTVLGQAIAVPYHDIKVTDSAKLASLTASYQAVVNGTLAVSDLPDIRDVFLDAGLRDMGFKVMAGLDGQQIITQACTQCHNSNLDQTITRARFNVDLSRMSDTQGGVLTGTARDVEIGLAIARLNLPPEDVRKMPPELFKTLDRAEIDAATSYLCAQMTVPGAQCANAAAFVPSPAPLPAATPAPNGGGGRFGGAGAGAGTGAGFPIGGGAGAGTGLPVGAGAGAGDD
ncbi:MAG: cytochrome c [Gammaproteobacteria bacterium]|nr:cytochrome c [Gammaproteobacteria bacterium]